MCLRSTRRLARAPDASPQVPMDVVRKYTLVQLALLAGIFAVTRLPLVDALFPVLIAVLVPLRRSVLPRLFGADNVNAMDAVGDAPPPAAEAGKVIPLPPAAAEVPVCHVEAEDPKLAKPTIAAPAEADAAVQATEQAAEKQTVTQA